MGDRRAPGAVQREGNGPGAKSVSSYGVEWGWGGATPRVNLAGSAGVGACSCAAVAFPTLVGWPNDVRTIAGMATSCTSYAGCRMAVVASTCVTALGPLDSPVCRDEVGRRWARVRRRGSRFARGVLGFLRIS